MTRTTPSGRRAVLAALAGAATLPWLAACGSRGPAPQQVDLGPITPWPAEAAALARRVDLQAVTASEVLQGTGLVYRLSYSDPYARRVYRDTRWAAPLPVLVATRLRQRIARAPVSAGADRSPAVALTLELEDCVQTFSSAGQSEVQLRLIGTVGDGLRRVFDRSAPAGADAAGAVRATSQIIDALAPEIAAWAASLPVR
ncbi:ABC-type transport auxiliary lipoprotein family protein [Roseateles amylovorans]|uniref:ABC-type transport auxiliary lipoprotein family protein n=1 Tax=Roseateles amylovorans TaxID=2978473 RepID=A0ABY6AVF1_9BURK|nr:ABC-type transport auxiliary lipoprotein family protein [Roseateles amylovorans]UXH77171.1 ABC-type transport auxiliary lipoprotein family protein [Roseateles amylovorans]